MERVKTRMRISIRDLLFHLQFQAIQSERPETGQKERMERTISVRKLRLGILVHLSRNPVFPGNIPFGNTKLVFPFTFQPNFPMSLKCEHRHNSIMSSRSSQLVGLLHERLKPPYWKLCLRETKFDSFLDGMIASLLCRYVECCLHLF